MNKEQFIAYMNKKLAVIKDEERKDIIDEYVNHIEMKVADGSSEEEAIAAFGDIDEMIKEILDAYNINPRQQDSFDYKVNDFLDRMFDAFRRLLGGATNMDADRIVRMVFEILLVLILLGLLRIPFAIIEGVGSGILRGVLGYGIGSTLGWIFRVLVNLIYLVVFIVVLVNIVRRRWVHHEGYSNKDIMDDFKESFNFQQAKEAVHRFTQGTAHMHNDENPYQEDQEAFHEHKENQEFEETEANNNKYQYRQQSYAYERRYQEDTTSILRTIMKIFGYLFMIPFVVALVCLWCCLAFMIFLSFQGVTIFGFYFLAIGAIIGLSSVIHLIDRALCKGGKF